MADYAHDAIAKTDSQMVYSRNRDSLNDVKTESKDSLIFAGQAGRDSLALAGFKTENRAWIFVNKLDRTSPLLIGQALTAKAEILNSGRTPGLEVVTRLGCNFFRHFPAEPEYNTAKQSSRATVAPQQTIFITYPPRKTPVIIQQDVFDSIAIGSNLYLYGDISYRDVFGVSHLTQWCLYYSIADSSWKINRTHNTMR